MFTIFDIQNTYDFALERCKNVSEILVEFNKAKIEDIDKYIYLLRDRKFSKDEAKLIYKIIKKNIIKAKSVPYQERRHFDSAIKKY